nr:putative quinone oxidoreductase [Quercus suber]
MSLHRVLKSKLFSTAIPTHPVTTTYVRRLNSISSQLRPLGTRPTSRSFQTTTRTMASVPSTMKGVIIEKTGGVDVLQYKTDVPIPELKEGQVLVKNDIVGINYIDTYFRTGLYPAPSFPYILGREGAGTIVSTASSGELYGLKQGDRVVYLAEAAYAEYTPAAAAKVYKLPDSVDSTTAAAALLQGLTAVTMIRQSYHVNSGDWVLVHAAAGGTGLWLVQLLRAVGANIIGTASTEEKIALARKAGAQHLINYSKEDVKTKVDELTKGEGVIAVFDGVGKSTFDLSLDCLARNGSLVSFGNASGAVPDVKISRLSPKNAKLMRPTLFVAIATRELYETYTKELFEEFVAKGNIDVRIHETYPLSKIKDAHNDLEGRKTTGKLLLDPSK